MEWLEGNLRSAYPFADQVTNPITSVFADAQVNCMVPGPYRMTQFDPQALTNAQVTIYQGATLVLQTTVATATVMGDYTLLVGVDSVRQSSYRFMCSTAALTVFPFLTEDVGFDPSACNYIGGTVQSVNGLDGDVILDVEDFSHWTIDTVENVSELSFDSGKDRVDCNAVDCEQVFTVNGRKPDNFGSMAVANDGCYRLIPHPTDPAQLVLYNFCTPCFDCDDVDEIHTKFMDQTDYFHQLAAIYHDQFNRYQVAVAAANARIEDASSRGDIVTDNGVIDISGRAFNPPYFTQLHLAITNSTLYQITVELTVSINPTGISNQLTVVPGSSLIHRYLQHGEQIDTFAGFPGVVTLVLAPQETLSLATEMHRAIVAINPTVGTWDVSALVTFDTGPSPLPDPTTVVKAFAIALIGAEPTTA